MVMQNERGQMLPRQGEMGENTPFTNTVDKRSANRPRDSLEVTTLPIKMLSETYESLI